MRVYGNILVPIDCSAVDDAVIGHVGSLAQQNGARVHLLHVVHAHTLGQNRALHARAERALAAHRQALQQRGLEVVVLIRTGEPDVEVLKQVREGDYDLVAMATHGHSYVGDFLFGSVSRTLKHALRVPLLLVPGRRSAARPPRSSSPR